MNFDQLRILYKLKEVYRANSVADRKESSAEHSWSCLVLADYFLSKHNFSVDRLKVYELLMYHDAVEIIVGDVSIDDDEARVNKVQQEKDAIGVLKRKLPVELSEKFAWVSAE